MDIQDILRNILTIVGYQGDKADVIRKFTRTCLEIAINNATVSLSKEKQADLEQRIQAVTDLEFKQAILQEYISLPALQQAFDTALSMVFTQFTNAILPLLSKEELEKFGLYMNSLRPLNRSI